MAEVRVDIPNFPRSGDVNIPAIMEEIGAATLSASQLTFVNSATMTGERWPALSPVTIARRRNRSDKPLRDTGRLMNSLQYFRRGEEVSVGSNLIYANIHNFGGNAGRNNAVRIPQRRFLPDPQNMPTDLLDEYSEIAKRHVSDAFNGRRGGFFGGLFSRLTGMFRR